MSRQGCTDCRECNRIEKRDWGPTREELDNEEALHGEYIGFCSCNYDTDDIPATQEEKQQKKNTDKYVLEEVETLTTIPHLAKHQRTGEGDVAKKYRAIPRY